MERFMSAHDTNPLGPKATQSKVGNIYKWALAITNRSVWNQLQQKCWCCGNWRRQLTVLWHGTCEVCYFCVLLQISDFNACITVDVCWIEMCVSMGVSDLVWPRTRMSIFSKFSTSAFRMRMHLQLASVKLARPIGTTILSFTKTSNVFRSEVSFVAIVSFCVVSSMPLSEICFATHLLSWSFWNFQCALELTCAGVEPTTVASSR